MRNIWTIASRDFRTYFKSPVAYIVMAIFLCLTGYFFSTILFYFVSQGMFSMGHGQNVSEGIIRPVYGNMNVIFLFLLPAITMRLFAEEKKAHTLELLMTSPVTVTEMVLGKFLSAFLFFCVMMAITLVYPIILFATGNPDPGVVAGTYIGILFMGSCYIAIGVLCSAMAENQIVAFVLTFGITLFLWVISWASQSAGPVWSEVLTYLSLIGHYSNFSQGLINTADVVYYVSFAGIGLFLTHRVLDSYRWR